MLISLFALISPLEIARISAKVNSAAEMLLPPKTFKTSILYFLQALISILSKPDETVQINLISVLR
jgi:hypothetical protein